AAPVALKRAGLILHDIDLVEMHEAFAAQVLSNLKGFESKYWAERAGFSEPVGEVDRAKLNVMGGSVAIGHPFGATGARITTTLLHELHRRGRHRRVSAAQDCSRRGTAGPRWTDSPRFIGAAAGSDRCRYPRCLPRRRTRDCSRVPLQNWDGSSETHSRAS